RPDSGPKLTGRERYAADIRLPGMLDACFVLSSQASATIRGIDRSAALAVEGVVAVITAEDLPEFARDDAPQDRGMFFLAHQRVVFVGQPVAVVLAESAAAAEIAADLVEVEYDPLPIVAGPREARAADATAVRPTHPDNVSNQVRHTRGDVERAFREAAIVVEREFHSHAVHQSYLEPRAVAAAADPTGGVTVYTPTQGQFAIRTAVAKALRLAETDVRVQPLTVGGGFGGKFVLLEPLAALLALTCGRPVRLELTRSHDFVATTPAPEAILRVALAASADGILTGLRADITFDTGFFAHAPYQQAGLMVAANYRIANLDITSTEAFSNRTGAGAYRAPGRTQTAFALETLLDEIAEQLDITPIELRLRNVVVTGDELPDKTFWPGIELVKLLEAARAHPLWTTPCEDGEGVGIGLGSMVGTTESASATMRLNADGTLSVIVGSVDLTGTTSGLTQIAAEVFGTDPARIRVMTAPAEVAPHAGGTGGSKILYTVGNATIGAARDAREQVLAIAADTLEAGPGDVEIDDDRVVVRGAPDRALTLAQVHARTVTMGSPYAPVLGRGTVANAAKAPPTTVHLARVRVDRETGRTQVTGYAAFQDVGRAINPAEIDGQIHGAVAQGIGWALGEALIFDDDGQLVTGSFMDYALPHAADVPPIDTDIHEYPSEHGPFGAKGVGEIPVVPPAAAIANAIANATGARPTELPMTPERVWRALAEREGRRR
ncbi:MAG TPA: xanthine dehydrogenase family protein molybdopterin-binding subunit, partial [Thermomicrobiales bacterium]|nr:xanthine dehydrogenase family protein molybdopterin-binding subunit [Thermomicrobiales bacterium]